MDCNTFDDLYIYIKYLLLLLSSISSGLFIMYTCQLEAPTYLQTESYI